MSSRNRWKSIVAATALLTVVAFAGPARAAPIVSLIPSATTVYVGETFWLDVAIGLSDPSPTDDVADLYGFQFSLMFDPGILAAAFDPTTSEATGVTEGPFLAGADGTYFIPGWVDPIAGTVGLTGSALLGQGPGVTGSGVLSSIMFTAMMPGVTSLTLLDGMLMDSFLVEVPATWSGSAVTVLEREVTAVPEPASLLLVATGAALAFARRGRRRP